MASVATGPGRARSGDGMVARVLGSLPRGGSLSDEVWAQRHRGVTLLLWAHVPAIVLFAQIMGDGARHGLLESLPVVALAVAASQQWLSRIARTTAAAFGLLTCSAILVHLSGGYIEAHFHFFVMVAVVVLYQEWAPFLASVAYVVLHHGVAGALAPDSVFNHPAGQDHPAQWALIHGAFILAICCAGIAAWRLNETLRSVAVEGEQQLLEAQRVAHLGSWAWDIDNDVVTWSDELHRLFGTTPSDFSPSFAGFMSRVDERDHDTATAAVAAGLASGDSFEFDFRMAGSGNPPRWLHGRGSVTERRNGEAARMTGTCHDITERKRAEEAVSASEERYRRIVETTREGVVVFDGSGVITFANARMANLIGYDVDDLVGSPVTRFTASDVSSERPWAEGESSLDIELVRRDGSALWVMVSATLLEIDGGSGVLAMVSDITDRKRAEEELAHQALHDHLTGLPNRALLLDRLQQALARSRRSGTTVAVVFLDLDRFKLVNDGLGHDVGDELLLAVASRLREGTRLADTVARFGGDEFVLVFEDVVDERAVNSLSEGVLDALSAPIEIDGRSFHVSASAGVTLGTGTTNTPEELIRDADAAMYRAKERARGSYEIFNEETRRRSLLRLSVEHGLRTALAEGHLRVHYQPLVTVAGGRILGAEALVRWQDPERGLVMPDHFIPVAEDSGLIVPIGAWVLSEACRQARRWREDLGPDAPFEVSVNLSARQLFHADLVDTVAWTLADAGVDAGDVSVCLEVTESVVMEQPETSATVLRALKDLGVRVGMDDFGTGYSSLAYLRQFPFDLLKIDRAFVAGVTCGEEDRAIVRTIVELARALGLTVVAEGVETPEQLAVLRELGCELAQGYLFARPMPADALTAMLRPDRDQSAPAAVTAAAPSGTDQMAGSDSPAAT
jgi:diguanylate cyclase (GGDEF)-like protein/PAS domain S-box-containing protein